MATTTIDERYIPTVQDVVPNTGDTITVAPNKGNHSVLIKPTGSLLALTITFPSNPLDGDCFTISSTQAVTTLTLNGGTIIAALSSFVIGSFATYTYSGAASKWLRIG